MIAQRRGNEERGRDQRGDDRLVLHRRLSETSARVSQKDHDACARHVRKLVVEAGDDDGGMRVDDEVTERPDSGGPLQADLVDREQNQPHVDDRCGHHDVSSGVADDPLHRWGCPHRARSRDRPVQQVVDRGDQERDSMPNVQRHGSCLFSASSGPELPGGIPKR